MSFNRDLLAALGIVLLTASSCATYNNRVARYYNSLQQGEYDAAARALDNNKLLKKDRNYLLYALERGKICHLLGEWDSSNRYFNEADALIETGRNTVGDVIAGTLINPMMQRYKAEDFEKYLLHYYKAINYSRLGQPDEAMVEARRITLQANAQEDKVGNKEKYSQDPFSLSLQGLIYEQSGDMNNAFIAYRNAADVYLENKGSYYGTVMPEQLKKDLVRTAALNGFGDEQERYERLLDHRYSPKDAPEGGELVLFWENGSVPVKVQQDMYFALVKGAGGSFFFTDPTGSFNIPFSTASYSQESLSATDLRSFRVAIPRYQEQAPVYQRATVTANGRQFNLEQGENVNTLAFATLKERMVKELATTLARLAAKKMAETAVRGKEVKDDPKQSPEQRKKEEQKKNQREAMALGLQLLNFATEKADTRNWQSLPHSIYYVRIPLAAGSNKVSISMSGAGSSELNLDVEGRKGGMQMLTVSSHSKSVK